MDITALKKTVNSLFTVTHQYQVPLFQRPYAWGSKQVGELWNDVFDADSDGHFLGPVVLYKTNADDEDSIREVIDGQQRLASLQILLAIIRDTWIALNQTRHADTPNGLLFRRGYFQDEEDKFVFRGNDRNWAFFRDFVLRAPDDDRRKQDTRTQMGNLSADELAANKELRDAWRNLRKRVKDSIEAGPGDPDVKLGNIETKLSRVELVTIEVTDLEDAFLLFETLNDRGLDLSAADLLKSHLLGKLIGDYGGDTRRLTTASNKWDEMLRTVPDRPGVTPFLRHYLLLSHPKVQAKQVFPLFKEDVAEVGAEHTLEELTKMSASYARLVNPPSDDPAAEDLLNLKDIGVDTNRVPLLAADRWLDNDDFIRFTRLLEVLTFRWIVTSKGGQDMETAFRNLGETLNSTHGDGLDDAVASLVSQLPTSREFRDSFRSRRMGDPILASYVLRKIENALVSRTELEIKPRTEVHIEHIMPVTSTEFWSGRVRGDESYNEVIQRWGNLTLLKSQLNESIQNADFKDKKENRREMDYKHSSMQMTLDLLAFDDWTSAEIDLRQQWMGIVADKIWSEEGASRRPMQFPSLDEAQQSPETHGIVAAPLLPDALESV